MSEIPFVHLALCAFVLLVCPTSPEPHNASCADTNAMRCPSNLNRIVHILMPWNTMLFSLGKQHVICICHCILVSLSIFHNLNIHSINKQTISFTPYIWSQSTQGTFSASACNTSLYRLWCPFTLSVLRLSTVSKTFAVRSLSLCVRKSLPICRAVSRRRRKVPKVSANLPSRLPS